MHFRADPAAGKREQTMRIAADESLTSVAETHRRYEMTEMHLFDEDASEEEALCESTPLQMTGEA